MTFSSCLNLRSAALAAVLLFFAPLSGFGAAAPETELSRGRDVFAAKCALCHQLSGLGIAGVIPPLAGSEWLVDRRQEAIIAVLAGAKGPITVKGAKYDSQMPALGLSDEETAAVLTYVGSAWSNTAAPFSTQEVAHVRSTLDAQSATALKANGDYGPLPTPPAGFEIAEVVRLDHHATRLASDGLGKELFILAQDGAVRRLDLATYQADVLITPEDYGTSEVTQFTTMGIARDSTGRLWISSNAQREGKRWLENEVTIWRTSSTNPHGQPSKPTPWFRVRYPYGVGAYNHGVSDLRFGPDGKLYLTSGSRTDAGEAGDDPKMGHMGEVDITACIWRFDPNESEPKIEVIARGIRNAYSLQWDGEGNLFTVSNGPNADAAEEMDPIVPPRPGTAPRHHGFPYRFADDTVDRRWYPNTPTAPSDLEFVLPVLNLGPAGLGPQGTSASTFTPHSCPAGMAWLGDHWPDPYRRTMLVGRFGNFLPTPGPSGYDVLAMKLEQAPNGRWTSRTTTFLSNVARPIDLHCAGGRIYILEYCRSTNPDVGFRPGRILCLTPSAAHNSAH